MKSTFYIDRYLVPETPADYQRIKDIKKELEASLELDYKLIKMPTFECRDFNDGIHIRRPYIKKAVSTFKNRLELAYAIDAEQFKNPHFGIVDYFFHNFVYDGEKWWWIDFDGFGFEPPEKRRIKFDRNFGDHLRMYRNQV